MSSTYEAILKDLTQAMKNKDVDRAQVLRSLKSKILEKEISERKEGTGELDDEQVIDVLMKAAKQRRESIEQYQSYNREDLAEKEKLELQIIESYLPDQMDEADIRSHVQQAIEETGATSMKEIGKVMSTLMPRVKGKADGSEVNRIVKEELENG